MPKPCTNDLVREIRSPRHALPEVVRDAHTAFRDSIRTQDLQATQVLDLIDDVEEYEDDPEVLRLVPELLSKVRAWQKDVARLNEAYSRLRNSRSQALARLEAFQAQIEGP